MLNFSDNLRLFTYKVAYDKGSAPNPFYNVCTLAICKPRIRAYAKVGDIIVGVGCKEDSHRIVYCMVVDQVLTWDEYVDYCQKHLINDRNIFHKFYVQIHKLISFQSEI